MRLAARALFVLSALSAVYAQTPNTPIKHVIVVIQENRTPDNLFGSNPTFEPGVNLSPQAGLVGNCAGSSTAVALRQQVLYSNFDIGHTHEDFIDIYNGGAMNGAAAEYYPGTPMACSSNPLPFAYVRNDGTNTDPYSEVQPYFDIATRWGFANYMFQTNQGPSFPAHQFLFSGTSAPVKNDADNNKYWE